MKITDVETFVVGNPPPRHGGRYFIFVTLTTDAGVTGVGEAYVATVAPRIVADMLVDVAERWLVGNSPFDIERFWRRAYGSGYSSRPDPTLCGVMSALEMACWDLVGKETGRPVYDLLGGRVHEGLRSYTYIYPPDDDAYAPKDGPNLYTDPDIAAAAALAAVDLGFTAVKFDPAGPDTVYATRPPSARPSVTGPTCCSAPTASSPRRAPCVWPAGSSRSTPCGSRSPSRPTTSKGWPGWPPVRPSPSQPGSA